MAAIFNVKRCIGLLLFICVVTSLLYSVSEGFDDAKIDYVCISLDKEARVQNVNKLEQTLGKPIRRFPAVQGATLNLDNLTDFGPNMKLVKRDLKPNVVGCYLSHYSILNQVEQNDGYTVIFEDDAKTDLPNLPEKIADIIDTIPDKNFDVVYLGILFGNNCGQRVMPDMCSVDKSTYLVGMHGYLVKNASAKKLADHLHTIDEAVDHKFKALIDQGIMVAYLIDPPIVNQGGIESTLDH
jgi:GR25 family glycosyltransferase involved in LPS biosynthesis